MQPINLLVKLDSIKITNDKGRLSKEDIDRMVDEAEKFKEQDEQAKKIVDTRNGLENYLYSVKSTLGEDKIKEKIGEDKVKEAIAVCDDGITWLDNNLNPTLEDVEAKKSEYEAKLMPVMSSIHQQGPGEAPSGMPGGMPPQEPSSEPTIEEVD